MAQRCTKCGKGRKTKKGLCKTCRPKDLGNGYTINSDSKLEPTQNHGEKENQKAE